MGAPRKNPPAKAAETIQSLAASGYGVIGIAKGLGVGYQTFKRWLEEDEALQEAFESGKEVERQALHAAVYRSAMEGKPANVNAFFLLKARHGYIEADNRSTNVNVTVAPSVMVMTDHGTDEEWAAKAAAQQRKLLIDAAVHRPALPTGSLSITVEPDYQETPVAPSWPPPPPPPPPPVPSAYEVAEWTPSA